MGIYRKLLIIVLFTISLFICKAETPLGFSVLGSVPHPICGEISMPADWVDLTEVETWSFEADSEAKRNGYLTFSRHYMTDTTPESLPLEHELCNEIKAFASLDEYEPMTLLLRTLQPLQDFQIEVSDLQNDTGDILDKKNLDLRYALALPFKSSAHNNGYTNRHEILVSKIPESLAAEKTYLFWLTAYVPLDCKEGIYKGKISIAANGNKNDIAILLRVFPIELQANPTQERGMHIGGHQRELELRRKYYLDMKEHGMNTVAPCNFSVDLYWRNSGIHIDYQRLDTEIALYKEAGFNTAFTVDMRPLQAWLVSLQKDMEEFKQAAKDFPANHSVRVRSFDISPLYTDFEEESYRFIVRSIVAHAKENDYPPLYFMAQEESTNKGVRIQQLQRFSKLLHEEGVTVTSWSNGTWGRGNSDDLQDIDEHIDIRYYNFIEPKVYNRTKKSNDFFGIYNHGNRLMFGFFGQKVKAEGMLQWAYNFAATKNMLSNGSGYYGSGLVYVGIDGPLPSPRWEMIREGCDDSRYIFTLQTIVEQLKKQNTPEDLKEKILAAETELQEIFDSIPYVTTEVNLFQKETSPAQYDLWRFKLIRHILALQNSVDKKALLDNVKADEKAKSLIAGNLALPEKTKVEQSEKIDSPSLVVPYFAVEPKLSDLLEDKWSIKPAVIDKLQLIEQQRQSRARAIAADADSIFSANIEPFQATSVKLFHNDEALFVYFDCSESEMDKIVTNCKVHDGAVYSDDAVELFIKPNPNVEEYYQIAMNSIAVFSDTHWYQDGIKRETGKVWDPALQVKAKKLQDSWRAVVRIPFNELGLTGKPFPGSLWYFNAGREQQPTPGGEFSTWAPVKVSFHEVFRWGKLFFSEIPAVMIADIKLDSAVFGNNSFTLNLNNNSTKQQKGFVKITSSDNLEIAELIPWTCDAKETSLQIPFLVKNSGKLEINLSLLDENKKTLYTAFLTEDINPVMSVKLRQKDVSKGLLTIPVNLNINQDDLKNYQLQINLEGGKIKTSETVQLKYSGEQEFLLNLADLDSADYDLTLTLTNKKDKTTAKETLSFHLIEDIF